MRKTETKLKILAIGADIIHEKGFNNTGLNEILKAAEVPKGSFYFYFDSKDDFGLALIDYYVEQLKNLYRKNGLMKIERPDERLFSFFDIVMNFMEGQGFRKGCPIGNLVQEMSDLNEDFRVKLESVFSKSADFIQRCLEEGMEVGIFKKTDAVREQAEFIFNSFEGAIMRAKLSKDNKAFLHFKINIYGLIKEH